MNAYEIAHAKVTEATKVYHVAVAAYRSMKIGDVEFLAAKATYKAAEAEYDAAYVIAQNEPEVIDDSCLTNWTSQTARLPFGGTVGS